MDIAGSGSSKKAFHMGDVRRRFGFCGFSEIKAQLPRAQTVTHVHDFCDVFCLLSKILHLYSCTLTQKPSINTLETFPFLY